MNIARVVEETMKHCANVTVNDNTKISMPYFKYFEVLDQLINQAPTKTLLDLLAFDKISKFAPATNYKMRNAANFKHTIFTGIEIPKAR